MLLQTAFDFRTLLLGEEDWSFLPEVILRSTLMFLIAIIAIRLIGKRGIMQGVFEIVTIITLGSAAGDPMFYKKVGLLPALLVFITIILMYRLINFIIAKNKDIEHLIEGKQKRLIKDKQFAVENFKPEELSKDEILSDLRLHGVSQLGQIDAAYIEPSGEISIFFLPDEQVDYGLPVRPELFENQLEAIPNTDIYSCAYCGYTTLLSPSAKSVCSNCEHDKWVRSVNEKRVT